MKTGEPNTVKRALKIAAPILVLITGVGVVQAMIAAKPAPEKKEEPQRIVSLYVDEVRADTVTLSVDAQGQVRPRTEIDLVPDVSGRIVWVSEQFAEGAGFEPGTTLVKIEDADFRLAVIRMEARVAEAERTLAQELASAGIKRQQWESTHSSQQPTPLQINQPQVAEARAKLASAQADLEAARLDLERTQIKAPFHGRVRARNVGVGQYVSVGMPLGRVFATDVVEVALPLTDMQLAELKLPIGYVAPDGQGPAVNLLSRVGNEDQVWEGRIVRTHAAIDEATRLIYAVAQVEDPYGKAASNGVPLAVGMFVSAEVEGVTPQDALVMPRSALRNNDQVYVVNPEDKLEIRTVDVLSTSDERVLVTAGVSAGERVVTSPMANAAPGMEVQAITRLAAQ